MTLFISQLYYFSFFASVDEPPRPGPSDRAHVTVLYPCIANCQPKYSTIAASGLAARLLELWRAVHKIVP
jgi:hypothetical protein